MDSDQGSDSKPSSHARFRVAVVGAGPSAFYATEALFKVGGLLHERGQDIEVDMFDRLPTPYGLVRGGVAPDHQKIKNVVRVYQKVAADPRYRFFGNVQLGRDVSVADLAERYDHIVYAVGNESSRALGIPGEELGGVYSATDFVGWYNGHPDYRDLTFELNGPRTAAVVGNGNVAMDVARVLLQDPERLATTDIADHALAALRKSTIEEVILLGRRGPAQAAFSTSEMKEIDAMEEIDVEIGAAAVDVDAVTRAWLEDGAPKSAQRNLDFLAQCAQQATGAAPKRMKCEFLVSPTEVIGDGGRMTAVKLQHNELAAGKDGTPRPKATERFSTVDCGLLFSAIGYRGVPIDGVPFHDAWGIIPNRDGRVLTGADSDEVVTGQYVVGWAKRGPTGLIGTNSPDAKATVERMVEDIGDQPPAGHSAASVEQMLTDKGIDFVSFADWTRLDEHEQQTGKARGKIREKVTSVAEMMAILRGS